MQLQQSPLYAKYIASLNWKVLTKDGVRMFYKRIPLVGSILKVQRPHTLPDIKSLVKDYNIKTVAIEPEAGQNQKQYNDWVRHLSKFCRVQTSAFMPSKTILIDLAASESVIFGRFSQAKRRAVRRAQKHHVTVIESSSIRDLINIKNKSGGLLGFITTVGIDKFWKIFNPKHASIILAYKNDKLIGGVLLVFWNKTAFYWIAGATSEGKRYRAPTILVWEALQISKKKGMKQFDFLGVWDERKSNEHADWKGFTRFKEGFGGSPLYYPLY